MAKVVVSKAVDNRNAGKVTVTTKRIRDADGRSRVVRTIDAGSDSFGTDFEYVFAQNVAKARRANKQIAGSVNIRPAGTKDE